MATSSWPTLTNSTTASAIDVEAKFDAMEGDIVPMDSAGSFTNDTFNIGTSTAEWANIYASNAHVDAIRTRTVSKSSDYSATADDHTILVDASAGTVSIFFPTAVSNTGTNYLIKKTDSSANPVFLDPSGTETIDGVTTTNLYCQYNYIEIDSDGTNWSVINKDMKCIQQIGDWDMDTNNSATITAAVPSTKFRNCELVIRNDGDDIHRVAPQISAAGTSAVCMNAILATSSSHFISLFRVTSGPFDNTDHNATSYNRGYVNYDYSL
jgi:hypothetical protein